MCGIPSLTTEFALRSIPGIALARLTFHRERIQRFLLQANVLPPFEFKSWHGYTPRGLLVQLFPFQVEQGRS